MDAVEFIKERDRMMSMMNFAPNVGWGHEQSAEEIVAEVEEWSAAYPRRTRQSVFLEQYPEAKIDESGLLEVCPYLVSATYRNKYGYCAEEGVRCSACRREFWMQEVE